MAKRGRPSKKQKTDEQLALEIISNNPAILEALTKLASSLNKNDTSETIIAPNNQSVSSNTVKTDRRIYKPPVKQVPYDDPTVGKQEGAWDKKRFPKNKFEPSERRPPVKKFTVQCKCGAIYETTQKIYGDEFGYTCQKCVKQRTP